MFETHAQARLQNPLLALEEGTQRWAYISQTANHEWFFLTYETFDGEVSSQQQFMIPAVRHLLGLAYRDTPEEFIREIQLVSPPWLNEKCRWLMEPIRAIHSVGEQYCYELMDGQIYPSSLLRHPRETLWSKVDRVNE
jgi:hypothetical protein